MWRSRKPSSTFSWKKIQRIASFGDGQRMENTQPRVPKQYNFRGLLVNWKWCRYGKPRWNKKCNFFAWTLLHKNILIAHNLMKRQWPHDPICKLCGNNPKTPTHLCKDCVFSKRVWETLKQWLGLATIDTVRTKGSLHNYWRRCRSRIESKQRKDFDGILIYYWWNIRK